MRKPINCRARRNISEDRVLICDLLLWLFLKASTSAQCWRKSMAREIFIPLARTRAITVAGNDRFLYINGRSLYLCFYRIKARCLYALNTLRGEGPLNTAFSFVFPMNRSSRIAFIIAQNCNINLWWETSMKASVFLCLCIFIRQIEERIWQSHANNWRTYVSNRVVTILEVSLDLLFSLFYPYN